MVTAPPYDPAAIAYARRGIVLYICAELLGIALGVKANVHFIASATVIHHTVRSSGRRWEQLTVRRLSYSPGIVKPWV